MPVLRVEQLPFRCVAAPLPSLQLRPYFSFAWTSKLFLVTRSHINAFVTMRGQYGYIMVASPYQSSRPQRCTPVLALKGHRPDSDRVMSAALQEGNESTG